jgi:hypothetical protein
MVLEETQHVILEHTASEIPRPKGMRLAEIPIHVPEDPPVEEVIEE